MNNSELLRQAQNLFNDRQLIDNVYDIQSVSIEDAVSSVVCIFREELFTMPTLYEYGREEEGICFEAYETKIRSYNLYVVPKGKILTNREEVFTQEDRVIREITSQHKNPFIGKSSEILKKPKILKGKILHLSLSGLENNYYHFTVEFLARWYLWLCSGIEFDWITFPLESSFHIDLARLLNIDFNKILQSENHHCLQADEIIVPDMINNWRLVHYRKYSHALKVFLPSWLPQCHSIIAQNTRLFDLNKPRYPKRIYISREKANYRYVLNEKDLEDTFIKYNIHSVCMEDFSLTEQILMFADLEMVISPHGAGLANIS